MSLSIIIPAYNEELYIKETLENCIQRLSSIISYEIIVIDNCSTDLTNQIINSIPHVKCISLNQKVTVAAARNLGWKQAKYDLVAFIDADMLITDNWVQEICKLEAQPLENLNIITGCKCLIAKNPSWLERLWFNNSILKNKSEKYINSGNLITTKCCLLKIDGFDSTLITGEDVDFCRRGSEQGAELKVNKKFEIYHEGYPKTIAQFFRREMWHGIGDLRSFSDFARSKVAIVAFSLNFLNLLSILLLFVGRPYFFIPTLIMLFIIVFTVHKKFSAVHVIDFFALYFLQFLYFQGRFFSIFKARKV